MTLDINAILGCQARYGGRADVIDAQGQVTQRVAQFGGECLELVWPGGSIGYDFNHSMNNRRDNSAFPGAVGRLRVESLTSKQTKDQ